MECNNSVSSINLCKNNYLYYAEYFILVAIHLVNRANLMLLLFDILNQTNQFNKGSYLSLWWSTCACTGCKMKCLSCCAV